MDKPEEEPMLIALERLRGCPSEVPDEFWPPDNCKKSCRKGGKASAGATNEVPDPDTSSVASHLGSSDALGDLSNETDTETAGEVTDPDPDSLMLVSGPTEPQGSFDPPRSQWAGCLRERQQKRMMSAVGI